MDIKNATKLALHSYSCHAVTEHSFNTQSIINCREQQIRLKIFLEPPVDVYLSATQSSQTVHEHSRLRIENCSGNQESLEFHMNTCGISVN